MKVTALLPLCLLLVACQTTGALDENSPFHILPSGSRLVLKQELTIPIRSAGVILQGGRVVSNRDVNQYHPHCRLEVNDVRETTQTVTADEFVVRRAYQDSHMVMRTGFVKTGLRKATSTIGSYDYRTILDLHSTHQPQVRSLICHQWGDPAHGQHVSIREIRTALGDIFALQLPDAKPGERK